MCEPLSFDLPYLEHQCLGLFSLSGGKSIKTLLREKMMVDDKSCTGKPLGNSQTAERCREILKFLVCCFVSEPKFVEEFIRKKYVL